MKKILIPILVLSFAFSIAPVLSATGNETSESAIVNYRMWVGNETNCFSRYTCGGADNRTICDISVEGSCYLCSLEGEVFNGTALIGSAPFCLRNIHIDNVEEKNFNILVKIFPTPNHDCYGNTSPYNCDINDWNPVARLRLPRADDSATDYIEIDTTPCWNWWNTTNPVTRGEQSAFCPIGSIYITSDIDYQIIEFEWGNRSGADIDYQVVFLGYSTSVVNIEEKISPSLKTVMEAIAGLIQINWDIWRILYYLFLIVSVVCAVIVIVGFFPLALKWILKKITA